MEFNATFLITIISFIVFALLMNVILYEPIKKIVEAREKYYSENNEIVSSNEVKGESLIKEKDQRISYAKEKSRKSIQKFHDKSQKEKENLMAFEKENLGIKTADHETMLNEEKAKIKNNIEKDAEEISDIIVSKIVKEGENA